MVVDCDGGNINFFFPSVQSSAKWMANDSNRSSSRCLDMGQILFFYRSTALLALSDTCPSNAAFVVRMLNKCKAVAGMETGVSFIEFFGFGVWFHSTKL